MTAFGSALINWSALWKIVLAALVGGCGVVIAFGIALLSLTSARTASSDRARLGHWMLATICTAACVGAVAVGVYAMVEKPFSNPAPKPKPAAAPAGIMRAPMRLSRGTSCEICCASPTNVAWTVQDQTV